MAETKLTRVQREWCEATVAEETRRLLPALLVCLNCGRRHLASAGGGVCRSCDSSRLIDLSTPAGRAALTQPETPDNG